MPKSGVPDRWNKYVPMGRQVPGTRFICFKTPLRKEASSFTTRTVMDHCTNLGLVIDLTNTLRYYDGNDFVNQGIEYSKLKIAGRKKPKTADYNKFSQIVCEYLRNNSNNDKLIGVHCTHGLNRTGYLVCRYMIQVLRIPPDQAIADFNSARGHEQEHEDYVEDLRLAPWLDQPGSETPGREASSLSNQENSPTDQSSTPSTHNDGRKMSHRSNKSRRAPWLSGADTPSTPATPATPDALSMSTTPSSMRKRLKARKKRGAKAEQPLEGVKKMKICGQDTKTGPSEAALKRRRKRNKFRKKMKLARKRQMLQAAKVQ